MHGYLNTGVAKEHQRIVDKVSLRTHERFYKLGDFKMLLMTVFLVMIQAFGTEAELKNYRIDPDAVTVSGVSSGAYMAVQMHVAHSDVISGAASVAGGVYWCAKGEANRAQTECMGQPNRQNPDEQVRHARILEAEGAIAPLANLRDAKVFVYASRKDNIIHKANSDRLIDFYRAFVDPALIEYENTFDSAHGFPTLNTGAPCAIGMAPWLLKCNFDLAGKIFKDLYRNLNSRGAAKAGNLLKFSQAPFGSENTPLFPSGWIYVPDSCQNGHLCRLHIALHGCQMNPDYIQDQFATSAGYNDWAEANKIVVLYPQSAKLSGVNPYACWDWFGFTGENYVTKAGAQMVALKKMIDQVMSK